MSPLYTLCLDLRFSLLLLGCAVDSFLDLLLGLGDLSGDSLLDLWLSFLLGSRSLLWLSYSRLLGGGCLLFR